MRAGCAGAAPRAPSCRLDLYSAGGIPVQLTLSRETGGTGHGGDPYVSNGFDRKFFSIKWVNPLVTVWWSCASGHDDREITERLDLWSRLPGAFLRQPWVHRTPGIPGASLEVARPPRKSV